MKAQDLVTDLNTRATLFQEFAQIKTRLMLGHIAQGKQAVSLMATSPTDFASMDSALQDFLIAAAGFSRKSLAHLTAGTVQTVIEGLLPLKEIAKPDIQSDLLHRFLLTAGDSLGGTMRNMIGAKGEARVLDLMREELKAGSIPFVEEVSKSGRVTSFTTSTLTFHFNKKPKILGKNVDIIVLTKDGDLESFDDYRACGELKSGIDPAGADEHWKTAKSALARIEVAFAAVKKKTPLLFFIGAAIEAAMAKEIVDMLALGELNRAANLHFDSQIRPLIKDLLRLT